MKKLVATFIVLSFILPSFAIANSASPNRNGKKPCATEVSGEASILRVCNDVSDIICKDVKPENRRSCTEEDEFVFSSKTSKTDIFNFAKGCLGAGVTSFTQFFTDFIPDLLKGMWDATSAAAVGAYDYATGKKAVEGDGFWASLKGKYESASALAADIYEAVQENPGAYFQKIWGKIVDVVGPLVASYDCLKPQKKVEGICGFVAGWVIPPAMLAKVLVRGVKELKFLKDHGTISVTEKGKLAKALAHSEQRSKMTLKELMAFEKKLKDLGYSQEEFELLYKSGALSKYNIDELLPVSTVAGKAQREMMLGKKKVETAAAFTLAAQKAKAEGQAEATRQAKINQAKGKANPSPKHDYSNNDFITTTTTADGKPMSATGQITERIFENGQEVGYIVRMVNPVTGKVYDARLTKNNLDKLKPIASSPEAREAAIAAMKKQGKYVSPEDEFKALQARQAQIDAEASRPASMDTVVVREVGMDDFRRAERELAAKEEVARLTIDEATRVKKAAEDAAFKAKAARQGMVIDEIAPDDPRMSMFGALAGTGDDAGKLVGASEVATTYKGGIDYVKPEAAPSTIVKAKEPKKVNPTPQPKEGSGQFNTPYIRVMGKDSMGVTSYMPAQITKTVREGGVNYYFIKVVDRSSQTVKEEKLTLQELKLKYKVREAPEVEKDVKQFYRATGHGDSSVP